ncbi:hypothetical protein LAV75_21150, partial [Shigella flexneri]|nr:hypothetical protein [Shigella flexneri]
WKPSAHSPEANMDWQKCSGIKRSYLGITSILVKDKTTIPDYFAKVLC